MNSRHSQFSKSATNFQGKLVIFKRVSSALEKTFQIQGAARTRAVCEERSIFDVCGIMKGGGSPACNAVSITVFY